MGARPVEDSFNGFLTCNPMWRKEAREGHFFESHVNELFQNSMFLSTVCLILLSEVCLMELGFNGNDIFLFCFSATALHWGYLGLNLFI